MNHIRGIITTWRGNLTWGTLINLTQIHARVYRIALASYETLCFSLTVEYYETLSCANDVRCNEDAGYVICQDFKI